MFRILNSPVALAASTSGLALVSVLLAGQAAKPDPKQDELKVRIVKWATDANVKRRMTEKEKADWRSEQAKRGGPRAGDAATPPTYKTMKDVKDGFRLEVMDVLNTAKSPVDIKGGTLALTRIKPNTTLKYTRIHPTDIRPTLPIELSIELEKGMIQNRIGTLAEQSRIQVNGPMTVTAAKGTAYSVSVEDQRTTLVVAEGRVDVALEVAPGAPVTVRPREKFVYSTVNAVAFDDAVQPISREDEALIRELLSLPVAGLTGYAVREVRRPDAQDIVVVNVRKIERSIEAHPDFTSYNNPRQPYFGDGVYKPSWKHPNTLYLNARDDIWTTDAQNRRRNVGKGYHFEALSLDGTTIYATKPNGGLFRISWDGSGLKQISKSSLSSVNVSPDNRRLFAKRGVWTKQDAYAWDGKERRKVGSVLQPGDGAIVALNADGTGERLIEGRQADLVTVDWLRGGRIAAISAFGLIGDEPWNAVYSDDGQRAIKVSDTYVNPQSFSPAGKWVMLNKGVFVRLSDGQRYDHGGNDFMDDSETNQEVFDFWGSNHRYFVGEEKATILKDGQIQVVTITEVGSSRPYTPDDASQLYPGEFRGFSESFSSPNGEILTWLKEGIAHYGDSNNLRRFSRTALRFGRLVQGTYYGSDNFVWVNGNTVYYLDQSSPSREWEPYMVTLGVKPMPRVESEGESNVRPSGPAVTPPNPTVSLAAILRFPETALTGVTETQGRMITNDGHIVGVLKPQYDDMQAFSLAPSGEFSRFDKPEYAEKTFAAFYRTASGAISGNGSKVFYYSATTGLVFTPPGTAQGTWAGMAEDGTVLIRFQSSDGGFGGGSLWRVGDRVQEAKGESSGRTYRYAGSLTPLPDGFAPFGITPSGTVYGGIPTGSARDEYFIGTWKPGGSPTRISGLDTVVRATPNTNMPVMNDRGQVAGVAREPRMTAFLFTPGQGVQSISTGTGDRTNLIPDQINTHGDVIGIAFPIRRNELAHEGSEQSAIIPLAYVNGRMIEVSTRMPPGTQALDTRWMNDQGELIGVGTAQGRMVTYRVKLR